MSARPKLPTDKVIVRCTDPVRHARYQKVFDRVGIRGDFPENYRCPSCRFIRLVPNRAAACAVQMGQFVPRKAKVAPPEMEALLRLRAWAHAEIERDNGPCAFMHETLKRLDEELAKLSAFR